MRLYLLILLFCLTQIIESRRRDLASRKSRVYHSTTQSSLYLTTPSSQQNFNTRTVTNSENLDRNSSNARDRTARFNLSTEIESKEISTRSHSREINIENDGESGSGIATNILYKRVNNKHVRSVGRFREGLSSLVSRGTSTDLSTAIHSFITEESDVVNDICSRHHEMKIVCFCYHDNDRLITLKSECWIFSKDVFEDDKVWDSFAPHSNMLDLALVVQKNGLLDYIPSKLFKSLVKLKVIAIRHGKIQTLEANTFMELKYLEVANLSNNHINVLVNDCLSNLQSLRELNLQHNDIYHIERAAFRNLPVLERLTLSFNKISSLNESFFLGVENLIFLDLANNLINSIVSSFFEGLGKLQFLSLEANKLRGLADRVFTELWSLVKLDLDNNLISSISNRALDGLNNLQSISLRNNKLRHLGGGILRATTALRYINLQNNSLESLSNETFMPILENLAKSNGSIGIANNKLICDCKLGWIFDLKNETYNKQLLASLADYICELRNPKLSDFEEPIPPDIIILLKSFEAMKKEREIAENEQNRYPEEFPPFGDHYVADLKSKNLFRNLMSYGSFQQIDNMYDLEPDELPNNETIPEPGIQVPLFSIKREALICKQVPIILTELPLSNMNGSGRNIFDNITILHFSIMICFLFYLIVR